MAGILDHLSKELRSNYTELKKGEIRIYELTGITKKKSKEGVSAYTLPNSRSIPDSYTVSDNGEAKSIVYTTKNIPTLDPSKVTRVVDPIEFRQDNMGRIRITFENRAKMGDIDKFLFFSPWLVAGRTDEGLTDRPWQMRDKLGQFFALIDAKAKAKALLEKDDIIFDAKLSIRSMSEQDMDIVVLQLKLGMPSLLSFDEKKALLIKTSENPKMAKRISTMHNTEDLKIRKEIIAMEKVKIIKRNQSNSEYFWGDSLEKICDKMPGKSLEDSIFFYFKTKEGGEVMSLIRKTMDAKNTKAIKKEMVDI